MLWVGLGLFAAVFGLSLQSCDSGDDLRDINYGTEAGAGYGGPEAGFVDGGTTQGDNDAKAGDDAFPDANSDVSAKDTAGSADATVDLGPGDAT